MLNTCHKKLLKPLAAVLLLTMTGCGANHSDSSASANGAVAAKLAWSSSKVAGAAKSAALAAVPSEVAKIRITVTGATTSTGAAFPTVSSEFSASTTSASVAGIYPGSNLTVDAEAIDTTGKTIYEGLATGVTVVGGAQPTDVGTITMTPSTLKTADRACVNCHQLTRDMDPVKGANLVADFKQSGHYANTAFTDGNGVGTGCNGCHKPTANHYDPSPYKSGRCFDCHTDKVTVHSNSQVGTGARPAMYASTNYAENCNACHQPHATKVGNDERHAWALSAHGDVNGAAWSAEDFQQPGQASCQRCHTGTGFKNFAISNFTVFPTTSVAGSTDTKREVLACDGCHTDNTFAVRTVGAFTAQYTKAGATVTFPSVGESNLCIACHSARENGVDAVTNFANASFKNSHYLPAAGLMYMSIGFVNFTSANAAIGTSTYGKTLNPDNTTVPAFGMTGGVSSTHRKLGTSAINGDSHNASFFVAGNLDSNGPCVVCHMNGKTSGQPARAAHGHTLAIDENAYNQVCVKCHTSENTVPVNAANFKAVFLEPQSEAFQAALTLAKSLLPAKGIEYDPSAYPYFFKAGMAHTSANAFKDWTLGTNDQAMGKKVMGACFNIQALTKDRAAYAHARSYSRRLLYDSIDFLDDGAMNLSVGATALASGLTGSNGAPLFTKGTAAYNVANGAITTIANGTSEGMLYILGWSRTAGTWNTPERP